MLRAKLRLGATLPSDQGLVGGGVSAGQMESDVASAASGDTFGELAEKLSKLRANLDQLLAILDAPATGRLRCQECGQIGSNGESGWTLRLCADDELHPVCPDCDSRYFSDSRIAG